MHTAMQSDKRAAIVCCHVAKDRLPILLAERIEPVEAADSGWQFFCNSGHPEEARDAQVWSISEVLELEPTLSDFVSRPPGARLLRCDSKSPWVVS